MDYVFTPISGLPAASAALGTDELPINKGGLLKKLTVAQIQTLTMAGVNAAALTPASVAATGAVSGAGLTSSGFLAVTSILSISLGATTENWAPTGYATAFILSITCASGGSNLGGITPPLGPSRVFMLWNSGADNLTLWLNDASSASNARFISAAGSPANVVVRPGGSVLIFKRPDWDGWIVLGA